MNLFYSPNINEFDQEIIFFGQENIHLSKVLRKKSGDTVSVTNGKGFLFNCVILESDKKKSILKILNYSKINNDHAKLKVGISLTKKIDRFEWFLEKSTEIGVFEITPIITQNSERRKFNQERGNKILLAAMKQSLRCELPILNNPVLFSDYLSNSKDSYDSYVATCYNNETMMLNKTLAKGNHSEIIIGPEGGFTLDEINLAKKANFTPVSLGENRLRTETAGVLVCSIFSIINQE